MFNYILSADFHKKAEKIRKKCRFFSILIISKKIICIEPGCHGKPWRPKNRLKDINIQNRQSYELRENSKCNC